MLFIGKPMGDPLKQKFQTVGSFNENMFQ